MCILVLIWALTVFTRKIKGILSLSQAKQSYSNSTTRKVKGFYLSHCSFKIFKYQHFLKRWMILLWPMETMSDKLLKKLWHRLKSLFIKTWKGKKPFQRQTTIYMKFRSTAVFIISENYRQILHSNTVKHIQIMLALMCLVKEK